MSNHLYYRKLMNSAKWRKLRTLKLSDKPLCEVCSEADKVTIATEVHHIQPIENGVNKDDMKRLAYDYRNLMSVCSPCHVQMHVELRSKSKVATRKRNDNMNKHFIKTYLQ